MSPQPKKNPNQQPLSARPSLRTAGICIGLVVGTLLLFSRSAGFGFLNYDDPSYVTQNPHVMAGLTWEGVVWAFTGLADYWHPLSWMGHMLDWQLFGENAAGHHWVSIIWHAANVGLVFLLLRRLLGSHWLAAFGAALFAWHPLRVESVTWITERKDVMSGFFFLLTLLAYLAYARRREEERPANAFFAGALITFVCGIMSKPMVVTVPVVLLLLDIWPLQRADVASVWRIWRALLFEKIPFFAISIVASVVTVHMQHAKGGLAVDLPLAARVGNALVSVARYLGNFFWPVDLVVCYPHPGVWPLWVVVSAASLFIAISAIAWLRRDREPWLLVGWGWMLVMLLPVIGILQAGFQAMADRYTYLPMLGWLIVCLCVLRRIAMERAVRPILAVMGVVALAGLSVATWRQQGYWRNSLTLFEHALAVDERNPFAHGFLGYTLASEGRADEADVHCRRSLELDPGNASANIALAYLALQRGDRLGAVDFYKRVIAADPRNYTARIDLGQLLISLGNRAGAVEHIRAAAAENSELLAQCLADGTRELAQGRLGKAVVLFQSAGIISPGDATAHFWSGLALSRMGQQADALAELKRALELKPDLPAARVEIGSILLDRGQPGEAIEQFQKAVAADPGLTEARMGEAHALMRLDRPAEAMAVFQAAAQVSPDDPGVQKSWGEALARTRNFDEAAGHYAIAVKLAPGDAEAHAAYGYMLALTNRPADAIREWEEALRLKPDFPGLRGRLESLRITSGL